MSAKHQNRLVLQRPYDIETEQQLLGGLLLFNENLDNLLGHLEPHHFADPLHGRIFEAIVAAVKAGKPANAFSLKNEFEEDAAMRQVGGPVYLAELCAGGRDCLDPLKWAASLQSMWFRRNLVSVCQDIQNAAQDAAVEYDAAKIADHAERMLADATLMAGPNAIEKFRQVGDVARDVMAQVTGPRGEPSVMFGLTRLDEMTGGMRPKELIIVGARPGMGKTAFAGNLALMAARQGVGVAFFSMEMAAAAVTLRLVTATAYERSGQSIAYEAARRSCINADDQRLLFEAEGDLAQLPLHIHEGRALSPAGMFLAAKRIQNTLRHTRTPLGLVIVDHIQKIRPDRDMRGNKVAEMTEISDALQKMAGTMNVPVVALSQLNRLVEQRTDRRPELSDLRESGAIEQDADLVLLLYREAYYVKKNEPAQHSPEHNDWHAKWLACKHKLDVHIAKQRSGSEGRCTLHFDAPSSALRDA